MSGTDPRRARYPMRDDPKREIRSIRLGLLLQLAAVGALAGGLALAVTVRLAGLHLLLPLAAAAGVLVAALATVPLTRNLVSGITYSVETIAQLAHTGVSSPDFMQGTWPLTPLFDQLRLLDQQGGTPATREKVLRQVGEQAAVDTRAKLAQDLHDSIKQQLFSITISTAAAQARWEADPVAARLAVEDAQRSARQAQVELSALLQDLRPLPLDGTGLSEALDEQCEALGYRTGADVSFDFRRAPLDYSGYPQGTAEALFRVTQEALANIARHARAKHVTVRLAQVADAAVLEVRDDGQGFHLSSGTSGTGIASIRERAVNLAGHAEIDSAPGKGTTIKVTIPSLASIPGREPGGEVASSELASAIERGRRAHYQTEDVTKVAGLLILLGAPLWLVVFSVPLALFTFFRTVEASAHVRLLSGGRSTSAREQLYLVYDASATLLLLPALFLWYLPVGLGGHIPASTLAAIAFGAVLLCLVAAAAQLLRAYRTLGRWLPSLSPEQQRHQIRERSGYVISNFTVWLIIVVVVVVTQSQFHLAAPALTSREWSDDAALAILVLWPVLIGIDYAATLWWRRRLVRRGEGTIRNDAA
jgi:signal transduction histidine kinase